MYLKLIPDFSVDMVVENILYLFYLVPASRLRPLIPDPLSMLTVNDHVFLSVVTFHCAGVRLTALPYPRFAYDQINIRTYVKDPMTGKDGAYFFRSAINSYSVTFLTHALKLPWKTAPFHIEAVYDKRNRCKNYRLTGDWNGRTSIEASEEDTPLRTDVTPPRLLTGPLIGFYLLDHKILRFEVKHPEEQTRSCRIIEIRFPLLSKSGLLTEDEIKQPNCAFLAKRIDFRTYLPPRIISKN